MSADERDAVDAMAAMRDRRGDDALMSDEMVTSDGYCERLRR